jgi:N-acetylmuramoyl-L-alanine amidase
MKFLILILFGLIPYLSNSQSIQWTQKPKNNSITNSAKQYFTGTACSGCKLLINNDTIKLYKTNAFAYSAVLKPGLNAYVIKISNSKKVVIDTVKITYNEKYTNDTINTNTIKNIIINPKGNVQAIAGKTITISLHSRKNALIYLNDQYKFTELAYDTLLPYSIYQLAYTFKQDDRLFFEKLSFSIKENDSIVFTTSSKNMYSLFATDAPVAGKTNSTTALYASLGTDRLGGYKLGNLDKGVELQIIGRFDDMYQVKLNEQMKPYVYASEITLTPNVAPPTAIPQNIKVVGDSLYDYVQIGVGKKLPYISYQQIAPAKIIVDVYGAESNVNWLMQYPETLQVIEQVEYQQVATGLMRVIIHLKKNMHWGHTVYYNGNMLVAKLRRPKINWSIKNMVIGVDAGHGGSNLGARGITGTMEKTYTLAVAKRVEALLQAEGAKVVMTRTKDVSIENSYRLEYLSQQKVDFAISIHLNSSGNPTDVKGTSTYYKHPGFMSLSRFIYAKMLETGLTGWGNMANFNFALNGTLEFPTALVETLFISHPEDEEKITDPAFQQLIAEKIVQGIKDWLLSLEKI